MHSSVSVMLWHNLIKQASIPSQFMTRSPTFVPIIIGSALFMQTLDSTVVVNALPTMARSLNESPLSLNLAISVYFLSTAVFLPMSGWAADRFGSRTVLNASIALFALSSLLCGLADNFYQLIAARALQGMAGAAIAPVGRLVLLKTVPKNRLVHALSTLTIPALIGPIIGPVLGGAMVTYASWRWIFYINIPMGYLGVLLVSLYVPNIRESEVSQLDVRGSILFSLGLAGLIFGLENLGQGGLSTLWLLGLLGGGVTCLIAYSMYARGRADAIIDLTLFHLRTFSAAMFGGMFARLVLGAGPFLLALLLQNVFGLSALQAGLLTFVTAVGAIFMKTAAPPLIRRFGFRHVLIVNTVLTGIAVLSHALLSITTPQWLLLMLFFLSGFFRSLQFTALGTLIYADVPPTQMSSAATLSTVGQQLSQAFGVALAALLLDVMLHLSGLTALRASDVAMGFVMVGLLSLCGLFFFLRLPKNAAAELSGHR
jgi:EmrB/QacA subfamily drug resistance transporter